MTLAAETKGDRSPVDRRPAGGIRSATTTALAAVRRSLDRGAAPPGTESILALQRAAGNAAVSALVAAKWRRPGGDAIVEIDGALVELRRDEPDVERVERGLKQAKAVGIPVDLEGIRPPASALAVRITGFGPASVPAKKPVPPPKPVPATSPLGKAAAKRPAVKRPAAAAAPRGPGGGGGAAVVAGPTPLTADKLLLPPVPPTAVAPAKDPAFTRVSGGVKSFGAAKRAHPPAASKAKEAQDAAVAPSDDLAGQAKAAKADAMDAQQPGTFDKKAFIAAVKSAIEAKSPKTLKEADDYAKSGKAGEVKGEVKGLVGQGKEGAAHDIEAATAAPPDQSKAVPKPVTPMAAENPGQVAQIPAAGAVPKPAPAEQLNLEAGKREVDQEMVEANVTDEQLAKSGEPEFEGALAEKRTAAAHADSAPGEYRAVEQATIAQGTAQAGAATAAGVQGMQATKAATLAKLVADKGRTKTKDEQRRAEVTAKVQGIFTATETDVKKILDGIDPKVEAEFEHGEAAARARFETYVAAKMSAYKRDRYGGWLGGFRWAKDKLFGMPDKVNEFYVAGRELYLAQMDGVIDRVANLVGGALTAAKQRIAKGRGEIASYVKSLPKDLQRVGSDAAKEIGDRFDQLESDVKDKENDVVQTLATKYVEARKGLDERIEALQAENRGLVDKAIGAIKAVINTIRQLAAMLRSALARAASVIGDIVGDPVGFLGNLISGIKGGIDKFFANITTHLKKGLLGWLFGQLGDAGIEIPDTFDLKGIVKLLASVFGLTWANIRNRLVRQIGETAMAAVERGVEIFQIIKDQGVAGLWDKLVEKIGDLKAMIVDQIQDFVITKIITAGITWLISLLNPAAAFIKACKLIYDVVMFFVNNAERIARFVNTVIDGVVDIAKGRVGVVVDKVESALGQMVPILIGFIASVLGIGGIGEKIRSIIQAIQRPINKALDFLIKTGLKVAGPIIRGIKGISTKVKAKVAAGKAWVKGKVEAGKTWAKGKARDIGVKLGIIRHPITAGGESHTLSYNEQTGQIRMASEFEGEIRAALRARVQKENRERGLKLDTSAIDKRIEELLAKHKDLKSRIDATAKPHHKSRLAYEALKEVGLVVLQWLLIVTSPRDTTPTPAPKQLGQVKPYKDFDPEPTDDRLRKTWREHVIADSIINSYFIAAGKRPTTNSEYEAMPCVMIYETASKVKDSGQKRKGKFGDQRIIKELQAHIREAQAGREANIDNDKRFLILADDSRNRLTGAVQADYLALKDLRGPTEEQSPDASAIMRAFGEQWEMVKKLRP
ncbi:phage tail protein [Agromyces sp. M3QZ16-3]|uniref:phage tail protein n=1 Tax=Agromyces sp. M3QZ16-3 TaxID=3447585 RepID=UPI003F6904CD